MLSTCALTSMVTPPLAPLAKANSPKGRPCSCHKTHFIQEKCVKGDVLHELHIHQALRQVSRQKALHLNHWQCHGWGKDNCVSRHPAIVSIGIIRHHGINAGQELAAPIFPASLCHSAHLPLVFATNKVPKPTISCLHDRKRALRVFRQGADDCTWSVAP